MRKQTGTSAIQLTRIKEVLSEYEDMKSDNEVIKKKSTKKVKRKLINGGVILDILQKKMDIFKVAHHEKIEFA